MFRALASPGWASFFEAPKYFVYLLKSQFVSRFLSDRSKNLLPEGFKGGSGVLRDRTHVDLFGNLVKSRLG